VPEELFFLTAVEMDAMHPNRKDNKVFLDSIGASLNYGIERAGRCFV